MEKKSSSCSFFFPEDITHLFAVPNVCLDALSSSSSIAKVNSNTDAPPSTVETQEVDLTPHDPQNPPSPPHASTSSSSVVQSVVSQGGSSESSNDAATTTNVTDDDQFQGMSSSSSSVQTVSVLREGIEDIIIKAAELIVEASIMSCAQIDSSKFIRDPLQQLLPRDIKKAKKVRVLITARDKDVHIGCITKIDVLVMRCLLDRETMGLIEDEMYDETADTNEQICSRQIEEDSGDMWWNSKTFHYASSIHMLRRRQTESLSYSDGRERQMECYPLVDCLVEIMKDPFLDICSFLKDSKLDILVKRALVTKDKNMKDPFLDICSFFEDSKLNMLVKRALVTKVKNIIAREYENWLPKSRGNEIPIDKCKSN